MLRKIADLETRTRSAQLADRSLYWQKRVLYRTLIELRRKQLARLRALDGSRENRLSCNAVSTGERRRAPRVHADAPVHVIRTDGSVVLARAVDLSRTGLGVFFHMDAVLQLFPDGQMRPGHQLNLRFQLPVPVERPAILDARARIVWSSPVEGSRYRVGMKFIAFESDGYQLLESYMLSCVAD